MEAETEGGMGAAMSDQERQKLCAELRNADLPDQPMCDAAADEIERLTLELANANRERLAEELQYQYACDKAQQREIERLAAENKRLQNELRLWKEQG